MAVCIRQLVLSLAWAVQGFGGLTGRPKRVAVGLAQVQVQSAIIPHKTELIVDTWNGNCLRPLPGQSLPGDMWTGNCLRVPPTQSPPHMNLLLETHLVGNCLRLTPSQSPPDMNFHSADGNCLRPTPGRSPPIDTYIKFMRYYPKEMIIKLTQKETKSGANDKDIDKQLLVPHLVNGICMNKLDPRHLLKTYQAGPPLSREQCMRTRTARRTMRWRGLLARHRPSCRLPRRSRTRAGSLS